MTTMVRDEPQTLTKNIPATALDYAEVAGVLATLPPDDERDRLAAAYRAAADRLATHRRRTTALRAALTALTAALIDAEGRERTKLLQDRMATAAELELAPDTAAAVAQTFAEALVAWSSYVSAQLRDVANGHADAINERGPERQRLAGRLAATEPSLYAREHAGFQAAWAAIGAELAPVHAARQDVLAALRLIDARLRGTFGDAATHGHADSRDIAAFVERARKAAA